MFLSREGLLNYFRFHRRLKFSKCDESVNLRQLSGRKTDESRDGDTSAVIMHRDLLLDLIPMGCVPATLTQRSSA